MKARLRHLVLIILVASVLTPMPAEAAPLYQFSSHTFTNCGATGRNGPSLSACRSAYSQAKWSSDSRFLNISGGIESWTAPATGLYQVTAAGASGAGGGVVRGLGAIIQATVSLNKGSVYRILVGQAGSNTPGGSLGGSGGGGGGTFFTDALNNPIVVAGGGGGATENIAQAARINGQTTTSGSVSSDATILGGSNGSAGASSVWTGGGAGLIGNSTQPSNATSYPGFALSFVNGGTGGPSTNSGKF